MPSDTDSDKKFRIEGSGAMLQALAQAIELALQSARKTPYRRGAGSVTHGATTIEVGATVTHDELKYMISSIDDAAATLDGWAEKKRCDECNKLVALLFDDAYLETDDGDGVVCCECYNLDEDGEST